MKVYFSGISGVGIGPLAELAQDAGMTVCGSDMSRGTISDELAARNIPIAYGPQDGSFLREQLDGLDWFVHTSALPKDHFEIQIAREAGVRVSKRDEFIVEFIKQHNQKLVAVAGTHGKTTTTSMASHVLLKAGYDPTISVGGILPAIHGNIRVGSSGCFITEACEYTNSFLSFFPKIELILNVDADHLDFFKDLDDIASSFHRFAALLPKDGTLIINRDTAKFDAVTEGLTCEVLTYSMETEADYTASDISFDENGCGTFTVLERGTPIGSFSLRVPGIHNISNALAVAALGRKLGLSSEVIRDGLSDFGGTERRFEYKGRMNGAVIIDDYAHHPTEISATLTAAKKYPHKKLYVAFQPHTYTRTKALLPEFAEALSAADHVVLADIYAAREKNTIGISSRDLLDALREKGTEADYFPAFSEIEDFLKTQLAEGDLLITMGAGNIVEVGEDLLRS